MKQPTQGLLTRFRPRNLDEFAGQKETVGKLTKMISTSNLPTAIVITGDYGMGKTTLARILARIIICNHRTRTGPCNTCEVCRSFSRGASFGSVCFSANQTLSDSYLLEQINAVSSGGFLFGGRKSCLLIDDLDLLPKNKQEILSEYLKEDWTDGHLIAVSPTTGSINKALLNRMTQFHLATPPRADMECWAKGIANKLGVHVKNKEVISRLVAVGNSNYRSILKIMQSLFAEEPIWTVELVNAVAIQNGFYC